VSRVFFLDFMAFECEIDSLSRKSVTNHQSTLLNIPEQRRSHSKKTVGLFIIGPIGCPETSNYQYTLRNIPEEPSSKSKKTLDNGASRLYRNVGYISQKSEELGRLVVVCCNHPLKYRDSSVSVMTRLLAGWPSNRSSIPGSCKRFFSTPNLSDRLCGRSASCWMGTAL
jgi:hypothetical protein